MSIKSFFDYDLLENLFRHPLLYFDYFLKVFFLILRRMIIILIMSSSWNISFTNYFKRLFINRFFHFLNFLTFKLKILLLKSNSIWHIFDQFAIHRSFVISHEYIPILYSMIRDLFHINQLLLSSFIQFIFRINKFIFLHNIFNNFLLSITFIIWSPSSTSPTIRIQIFFNLSSSSFVKSFHSNIFSCLSSF